MLRPESIRDASNLPHPKFDTANELFSRISIHFDADTVHGIMSKTVDELFGLTS